MTNNGPDKRGLTRRATLLGLAGGFVYAGAGGRIALAMAAAPTDRRLVVVILRGALDGMAAVPPYGDAALAGLRGDLLPPAPGEPDGLLDLGGFYGLHPALASLHEMYAANEALIVHAVAGPYRSRSHFEAQDCLESGADHRMTSGWLNRAVAAMPANPAALAAGGQALAIGVGVPLLLRGPATVGSWAPHGFAMPDPGLYAQIATLNAGDPVIGPAVTQGLRERGFSAQVLAAVGDDDAVAGSAAGPARYGFPALARDAGAMLAAADGPRIAAMELGGWDTHTAQIQRLAGRLRTLDAGLAALKQALGPAWQQTAVLVMTEFGRTARMNGTRGTDHGTGTVAFVLGGAVQGGRVLADWPGLGAGRLLDDRDLQPTTDLRAVAKGLLGQHLGLPEPALAAVFPGSERQAQTGGLMRA
jgi:uncharacterized protein (DUF1501 family)